jgi:GNAT superfamily N-acetyltransferase
MQIEQVSDKNGLDLFIHFPWKVYRGNQNWVPPLIHDMKLILGDKNPFFHHAEAAYFLARKDGDVVGRIAAIMDRNHINFHKEQAGFFGFFECLPDVDVAQGLLNAAATWLRERDIEIMRGPMNPSVNDECGFLLEGFESPPMIMMTYTPPYYLDYMERCGLTKSRDLFAYISVIKEVTAGGRLEKLASGVRARVPGITVRPANMKQFQRELETVKDIYNSAWSHNWGYVAMTNEEIEAMAKRLKPLIVPELLIIAEVNGSPAAFFMAVPDYNQVLNKMDGRMGPVGIVKFLWYSRKIRDIRVLTLGVKEEYRKRGIEGLLYLESFKAAMKKGYERAEMSWILEDNVLMQRGCELMGGKLYKKYRIYEKRL